MFKLQGKRGAGIAVAALILILDQILKFLFYGKNLIKEELPLIKGLLYIVPASENSGIAFGLLQEYSGFFIVPVFIVILSILFFYLRTNDNKPLRQWGLLLILAGALSNLIDRTIYGYVIDYLLLNKFPYSFNLADASILAGVVIIMINILKEKNKKSGNTADMLCT